LLISCNILTGISDHSGILLEVEWDEICPETKVESLVPLYQKTDITGSQAFLRDEFNLWAGNGSCVEEIWKNIKDKMSKALKSYVHLKF
jgi:DNA topoisomerase IB